MAVGFPTKANWVSGDILTASQMDDLAGTLNTVPALITASGSTNVAGKNAILNSNFSVWQRYSTQVTGTITAATSGATTAYTVANTFVVGQYVTVTGMTPTTLNAAGVVTVASGTAFTISATTSGTFSVGGIATGSPYIAIAASTLTPTYSSDRWATQTGTSEATTISRQPTNDTTNLPNIQYCARFQRNAAQTGTAIYFLSQSIETLNAVSLAGKTVTVSYYARAGANYSAASGTLGTYVYTGTGTDQNVLSGYTGSATPINGSVATLTTTWQRFSFSATLASTTTEAAVLFGFTPVGTAGANDYFEVTGVQLEIASTATAYSPNGATQQAELAACQRYLPAVSGNTLTILGYAISTTGTYINYNFPVTARVAPTGITTTALSTFIVVNAAFASSPPTSLSFYSANPSACSMSTTTGVGVPTLVQGQGTYLNSSSASSFILFTGCEL